jgi:hypothetical protein
MKDRQARRFTEFVKAVYERKTPAYRGNKLKDKEIAAACGVGIPAVYREFDGLAAVDFDGLPERFVFKVDGLSSTKGVYLLVREGDGFRDLLRGGQRRTREDIVAEMTEVLRGKNRLGTERAFAEELVTGENGEDAIPYDYKFFAFGGFVPFIEQIDRSVKPRRVNLFGEGFSALPAGLVTLREAVEGVEAVPRNADDMLDAVRRVATHVNAPFCRVDLYTSGDQVYLGEVTPGPGPPFHGTIYRFSPEFDGEMGGYWRMRLHAMGVPPPRISKTPPAIRKDRKEARERKRARAQEGEKPAGGLKGLAAGLAGRLGGLRTRVRRAVLPRPPRKRKPAR